ncbi:MAG: hypothetical protein ACREQR_00130 [Candidatus Binataceae bacterium]
MAKNLQPLIDREFQSAGHGAVDERGRISLTKALAPGRRRLAGREKDSLRFAIYINSAGQILLSPELSIPLHEAWLLKNPDALASIGRGLRDSARRRTRKAGSFAKHASDAIE